MSVNEKRPLPVSWTVAEFDQFISFVGSGITPRGGSSNYLEDGIKFLRSQNVYPGELRLDDVAHVSEDLHQQMSRTHVEAGDVLLNITGASIGRSATVPNYLGPANVNQHVCILRTDSSVFPGYLSWYLNSPDGQNQIMNTQSGVTRQGLNYGQIRAMTLPLSPIQEQKRIVAEIEKQFTRLDQAVASLKRAQANLQRYKASVLKAACEGRLVPQDPTDETAEILLQRILAERLKKWQEQEWAKLIQKAQKKVAQSRRKAQNRPARLSDLEPEEWQDMPESDYAPHLPKNDKWKEKYKEPEAADTAELPPLPEGWTATNLDNLLYDIQTGPFGSSLHKSDYVIDGIPVINPASIIDGRIIPIDGMSIDEETRERLSRFILSSGDVIMGRRGEMGRSAAVTDKDDGWLCGTGSLVLRFAQPISRQFMVFLFGSESAKAYLGNASVGTTMQNLNQKILLNMLVGLPPENEQQRIVAEVERRLSIIAANEKAIATDLARAERLRQSILQQAFSGQLVPQNDPL